MEFKDLLPIFGVAVGWFLSEASAFGKRSMERRKAIGRSISVLYFLCLEMVQIKMAQERFKDMSQDVKQWERYRQRCFKEYTNQDPEFPKRVESSVDAVAEFYPIEAYHLREITTKYQFLKSKSLKPFTDNQDLYLAMLSGYEMGHIAYQHKLEHIVRFLAFQHSTITWLRMRLHFRRVRKQLPDNDLVFLEQIKGLSKKRGGDATVDKPKGPAGETGSKSNA